MRAALSSVRMVLKQDRVPCKWLTLPHWQRQKLIEQSQYASRLCVMERSFVTEATLHRRLYYVGRLAIQRVYFKVISDALPGF